MLESLCHTDSFFLTLTYTDETLPVSIGSNTGLSLATLRPKDLQDWLKRFRVAIEPLRIRFYACGEYGETSDRPHYHVCVFGFPGCQRVRTKTVFGTSVPDAENCCPTCRLVHRTWGKGHIYVGELTKDSAQYTAAYTVKKLTSRSDPKLLGRHPEFGRQSQGIGRDAMWDVASQMMRYGLDDLDDVPSALRHGGRELPLGRYLMRKLREKVGRAPGAPQATLDKIAEEMLPLRLAARENISLKEEVIKASEQRVRELEAKEVIWKKRNRL